MSWLHLLQDAADLSSKAWQRDWKPTPRAVNCPINYNPRFSHPSLAVEENMLVI